ncbi:MAG TPA: type II secretion system secretin GspD [Myxococcales bacterium]
MPLVHLLVAALSVAPAPVEPVDHKEVGRNAKTVLMSFDKRDLAEVIQFVSQFTQRNFILPERLSGKITILSNVPIPADEVWNVFLAALDANNWAVYPVGRYWKLVEKKQSSRAGISTYLESGQEVPATEQMVTKLFKLGFVEAEQMRSVLAQFTSRDSDLQIVPPDTLILSDLGLNMRRLEKLIEQLDQPGGSQEIHIVAVQHAGAQDLAQKLGEILQAQTGSKQGPPAAAVGGRGARLIADERTNKLVVIAGDKSFQSVLDLVRQLDIPTGDGGVHVYYLENAKAEDVASTLQSFAQGLSGKRRAPAPPSAPAPSGTSTADLFNGDVKVTADKNTNSLVVIASQADYRNVVKLIERLDIARRQVFVEAVIMEVNLEDDTELGASLHGGTQSNVSFGNTTGTGTAVLGTALGGLSSLGGVSSLASLNGFLAGIQGPPITVSGVSIPAFGVLLQALQSSSNVNVISTPHLIMTDNTEGEITVGQNVPFQAAFAPPGVNGSSTSPIVSSLGSLYAPIQRQNVELKLHIKAQINQGDFVRLEVDEQTEEIASVDKTLGPTTSKRSAKTTVVARDQESVVIGGLIQERLTRSVSKVPVLGSLPLLGWLFRNESTKKQKTNLLLFLTPYIIRDQSDVRRIFERKMAEREEFVGRFYNGDAEQRRFIDYDHKPGPLARLRRGVAEELSKVENGGAGIQGERRIEATAKESP